MVLTIFTSEASDTILTLPFHLPIRKGCPLVVPVPTTGAQAPIRTEEMIADSSRETERAMPNNSNK